MAYFREGTRTHLRYSLFSQPIIFQFHVGVHSFTWFRKNCLLVLAVGTGGWFVVNIGGQIIGSDFIYKHEATSNVLPTEIDHKSVTCGCAVALLLNQWQCEQLWSLRLELTWVFSFQPMRFLRSFLAPDTEWRPARWPESFFGYPSCYVVTCCFWIIHLKHKINNILESFRTTSWMSKFLCRSRATLRGKNIKSKARYNLIILN